MGLKSEVTRLSQKLRNAKRAKGEADDYYRAVQKSLVAAKEAQAFLQEVAARVQRAAHVQISGLVTRCLAAVGAPYTFEIRFDKKRGKTEARPVFVSGEGHKDGPGYELDPTDGVGNGFTDVAAFALRLAEVLMQQPPSRRLLILDEPFKFPSVRDGLRDRVREMLVALADDLGFQFIVVTHDSNLEVGKVINLDARE